MYHLGRSSAGTPIAVTQGMEDIILQPPSRKLVSSFFSHELNWWWGSLIQTAVLDPLLHRTVLSLTLAPHPAFFVPHHHFPLNFTVIYPVGLKGHQAVPRQLHAIVLSSLASKVSCVVVLPHPGAMKKKRKMMPFFFSLSQSVGPLELKTRATNRFSRHFAPVLSGSSSTG